MQGPSPADLQQMQKADVIIGVDEDFGNRFIVYGRAHLERIRIDAGVELSCVILCHVGPKTMLLEKLLALVEKLKGHHDFVQEPTDLDEWAEAFFKVLHEGGN